MTCVPERIPLVDPDDESLQEPTRSVLRGLHEAGMDFNVIRALANHQAVLEGFMSFSAAAYWGSSIDPGLRELAYLTASNENRCHY
jgi:alkylhydroperoxidase family enzyme